MAIDPQVTFDPNAPAQTGSGIFGLPHTRREARVVLLPVPFDATTSYGGGTSAGPGAIVAASMQVDLYDRQFGRVYERGIWMEPVNASIVELSREARRLAVPVIEKGGAGPEDAQTVSKVDAAGEELNAWVHSETAKVLAEGRVPGLVGGDHSTPFGAIRACAEHAAAKGESLGILHVDAHMDLREAFEGFRWSHASIMYNVMSQIPEVSRLIQVGIRDFGEGELDVTIEQGKRITAHYDSDWAEEMAGGTPFMDLAARAIAELPKLVYISFDIDGLDPSLCPHTGTPVPGGLSFNQAVLLLKALKDSGRTVVGFDLVEVCPGPGAGEGGVPEWDANVGARMLYKLCGVV